MIRFDSVNIQFEEGKPLFHEPISFSMKPGECWAICGESGTGKTTMLSLMAGLLLPTKGQSSVDGKVLMNFSEDRLLEHRSAPDNLVIAADSFTKRALHMNLNREELLKEANDLLGRLGVEELPDRPVKYYSKGMRRRVSLARALLCAKHFQTQTKEDCILLLDEPFSGLDEENVLHGIEELKKILQNVPSIILVYVSHNEWELKQLGIDRIISLS